MASPFVNSQRIPMEKWTYIHLHIIYIYLFLPYGGYRTYFWRRGEKMKDFDELCRDFEKIDSDTYAFVLGEKAMKLIKSMREYFRL